MKPLEAVGRMNESCLSRNSWNPSKETTPGLKLSCCTAKDAIPCEVVLERQLDDHCRIARYKGRVVAKGNVQKDDVDYHERFAPFIRFYVLLLIIEKFTSES